MTLYTVSDGNSIAAADINQIVTQVNIASASVINVKEAPYNAYGDGSHDDTTPIAAARSAANSAGGGIVFYPAGTYISGTQTLYTGVQDVGSGIGVTTIKLKSGSNADLFSAQTSSINLAAAFGTGTTGTLTTFAIRHMTLDGNKAGQASGPSYPLRFYGYDFFLEELEIKNGYTGGVLIDWNGGNIGADQFEARISMLKIHDCNGIGYQQGGPSDCHVSSVFVWNTGSHGFHFAPNAVGSVLTACHPYAMATSVSAVAVLLEAQDITLLGCIIEGSDTVQLAIFGNDTSLVGGVVFGNVGRAGIGIQLGQNAGDTPLPGQVLQSGGVTLSNTANNINLNGKTLDNGDTLYCRNESYNALRLVNYQTTGNFLHSGAVPNVTDLVEVVQSGLASDYSINTTSFMTMPNTAPFYADQYGNITGASMTLWRHIFQTAASPVLTGNDTIASASGGVFHVTEAGNVTGIILAAGQSYYPNMECVIINESAHTVTFATQATSHIAGSTGSNVVIAAQSKAVFWWDANTSLWYI